MSNYRKLDDGAQYLGKWTYSCHIPPKAPVGDSITDDTGAIQAIFDGRGHISSASQSEQRRMIKAGVVLALSIMLGIGLGVGLERGWTAMNAEVIEVAK